MADDFELPVSLPPSWWRELNALARKHKKTRESVLKEALKLWRQSKESNAKTFGDFSREWWKGLSPEQRAEESKKRKAAANARWAKEKAKK